MINLFFKFENLVSNIGATFIICNYLKYYIYIIKNIEMDII